MLDVGGRAGALADFLPGAEVSILDKRPPETPADRSLAASGRYLVGDIVAAPLSDARFDVVFSMDVLEHLPRERRAEALRNMLDAARVGVVVGFPVDSPEVREAEETANARYRELNGEDHPWLREHFACRPLPAPAEVEDFLRSEGWVFRRFAGNNVSLWLPMMEFLFLAWRRGIPTEPVERVYRDEFLAGRLGDAVKPAYRAIYAVARGPEGAAVLEGLRVPVDQGDGGAPGRHALALAISETVRRAFGASGGPGTFADLETTRLAVRLDEARFEVGRAGEDRERLEAQLQKLGSRLSASTSENESLRERLAESERWVDAVRRSIAWRTIQALRGLVGRRW